MAHDRPTAELPREVGWYVVWMRAPGGSFQRHLFMCFHAPDGDEECPLWCKPLEDDDYTPSSDDRFHGALWHGPFPALNEACVHL
jgi:hypothetical protein